MVILPNEYRDPEYLQKQAQAIKEITNSSERMKALKKFIAPAYDSAWTSNWNIEAVACVADSYIDAVAYREECKEKYSGEELEKELMWAAGREDLLLNMLSSNGCAWVVGQGALPDTATNEGLEITDADAAVRVLPAEYRSLEYLHKRAQEIKGIQDPQERHQALVEFITPAYGKYCHWNIAAIADIAAAFINEEAYTDGEDHPEDKMIWAGGRESLLLGMLLSNGWGWVVGSRTPPSWHCQ